MLQAKCQIGGCFRPESCEGKEFWIGGLVVVPLFLLQK
jgi:hypothetical protein